MRRTIALLALLLSFVLIFAAIELLTGVTGTGGGIAHFAHLGGLIFGYLLILYWKRNHTLYSRMD